eukprot:1271844-Prymnesium_polylepis.1
MRACVVAPMRPLSGSGRRRELTTNDPSPRGHWFDGLVGHSSSDRCDDSCFFLANDGECDDGG